MKFGSGIKFPFLLEVQVFILSHFFFLPKLHQIRLIPTIFLKEYGWKQLYAIDPERALKIHPNDTYRIKRALAIYQETGRKPSELKPIYQPIGNFCFVYINRDKRGSL